MALLFKHPANHLLVGSREGFDGVFELVGAALQPRKRFAQDEREGLLIGLQIG